MLFGVHSPLLVSANARDDDATQCLCAHERVTERSRNPVDTGVTIADMTLWTIAPAAVDHPESAAVLRAYFVDIVGRYHGRAATEEEVDSALADEPGTGLVAPAGLFLLAKLDDVVSGCVGVRVLGPGIGGLTKMFVSPHARRQHGASQLISAAEDAARGLGLSLMRLDVRGDLVEARALYASLGYQEVAPFSDAKYADHWFEKAL
jgi:GNAT superfamily N-acetyltransferase